MCFNNDIVEIFSHIYWKEMFALEQTTRFAKIALGIVTFYSIGNKFRNQENESFLSN